MHSHLLNVGIRICVVAFVLQTAFVCAQQNEPQKKYVKYDGKIKAMARGLIHVIGEDGQQWLVSVEAKPQDISFQASATQAFLRPGMLVQFRATIDKKGEASSPITEIRVVAPREGIKLGLQQEGGFGGKELFASNDEAGDKKKKKVLDNKQFQIAGTLRSIKDRKVQVAASGVNVRGELADNCSVSVDISDYSLAREGDPISLQGWHIVGNPDQVHATNLVITAEKPLQPADEKKRRGVKGSEKEATGTETKKELDSTDKAGEGAQKPPVEKGKTEKKG